tara:strand:+ start:35 stop:292 length:258 start_codon:yes stop_codon:yes gene_type:complete
MRKKAQGLPLNVIIIAVIVLVVLVVIWVIFTGRLTTFSEQLNECRGYPRDTPCNEGFANMPDTNAPFCCISVLNKGAEIENLQPK